MGFLGGGGGSTTVYTPPAPAPPELPPAAIPPTLADASRTPKKASKATGMGFGDTLKTSPQGVDADQTKTAKASLLGG